MSLNPTLQVRPLSQKGTTRLWHRPPLYTEMALSPWPGFATSLLRTIAKPVPETSSYDHTGNPH